ncbi:hypothetical protein [Nocardia sp. NRRL S-836]|uniref:hypothetical protein n=1 Tax=Nocardia sp. NRRL S-836 TaxID=1519492 RepID=UPI0006AFCBF3|nr:hypothetical protein [Nocardia sp. NRRL S-836]KOV79930.1 hypothetical protein ADL03_35090 [Nocardia sp. NRRL S-836]
MNAAHPGFVRWINEEWGGDELFAAAMCLDELAEACGGPYGEWGTLSEQDQSLLLRHFSSLHPGKISLRAVAFEYRECVGDGNLRELARRLRDDPSVPAHDFAPVWWRRRRENRVSTHRCTYTVELRLDDYDRLIALVGTLAGTLRAEADREHVLDLKMIHRELERGRHRAVPAMTGQNRWEFFVILTAEHMDLLRAQGEEYRRSGTAPGDFRAYWRDVDKALRSARSIPFS